MSIFAKSLFGTAYSFEDLKRQSKSFLSASPPIPSDILDVMRLFDGRTQTFVQFIQGVYPSYLKSISERKTQREQREELVRICIQEQSWRALERAAKDAKRVGSWKHFVEQDWMFQNSAETEWSRTLVQRYLTALVISSWLTVLGRALYKLDDIIEEAMELHVAYDTEIKKLDINFFEYMFEQLENYDDDAGMATARLKDDVVNPIIREQYEILDGLAKDIVSNQLKIDKYQSEFSRIDGIKKHVAAAIVAMAS